MNEPYRGYEENIVEDFPRDDYLDQFLEFFETTEKYYDDQSESEQNKQWGIFENYILTTS